MNLAKLTSISTTTLSLLLERQRLQTMTQAPPPSSTQQILRNLDQLRAGILALEAAEGQRTEASSLLRNQFGRMREMLGRDGEALDPLPVVDEDQQTIRPSTSTATVKSPAQNESLYVPYSDEPPPSSGNEVEPSHMLEQQRLLMEEQDTRLDRLSQSVGRQRDISININDELTVHNGLLDELGNDVDGTQDRLSQARKKLQKFSRGVKGNLSTYMIGAIIFILLILIIIFKT